MSKLAIVQALTQDWIIHRRDDRSTKISDSPNTVHLGASITQIITQCCDYRLVFQSLEQNPPSKLIFEKFEIVITSIPSMETQKFKEFEPQTPF